MTTSVVSSCLLSLVSCITIQNNGVSYLVRWILSLIPADAAISRSTTSWFITFSNNQRYPLTETNYSIFQSSSYSLLIVSWPEWEPWPKEKWKISLWCDKHPRTNVWSTILFQLRFLLIMWIIFRLKKIPWKPLNDLQSNQLQLTRGCLCIKWALRFPCGRCTLSRGEGLFYSRNLIRSSTNPKP